MLPWSRRNRPEIGGRTVVEGKTAQAEPDIVVFCTLKEASCSECGAQMWPGSFLRMERDKPLCMTCADLDHLVFLPGGDAALTRRSRKYSTLSAVVVRFSRARKRYERQGLLVEAAALERAEQECLGDEERRQAQRERAREARERTDAAYLAAFAEQIRIHFPGCPADEAKQVATHACEKYSGRVGRSAAAKQFDAEAIELALRAHVRHCHTEYDRLLSRSWDRGAARAAVAQAVEQTMRRWAAG